ncbi:conserved hypothetical protein [Leishmania braziliensis MHOM/BR/75/M2904]|uniref:Ribosomal protein L7Ae/L30e/S12e/Gadd45 domain-containing protein n=1 Tax=Leishmania braziliensis TaxID=5660 RepID=A4HJ40_LEIBR|nr:conserved hypothetical protein [Leishmania braziliensis MHOM/BR/75/M2904]CAM42498.1 conserved hypothetical protein [Leishmania braziliensis MHOM/BR/75/M2904]
MPLSENALLEQHRPQEQCSTNNKKRRRKNAPSLTSAPTTTQPQQLFSLLPRMANAPQPRCTTARNAEKAVRAKIKGKKWNPNAVTTPFNHRARFTKLKRGIHVQRRWALEFLRTPMPQMCAGTAAQAEHFKASPASLSSLSSTEVWTNDGVNDGDARADVGTRKVCRDSQATVERTVASMNSLYARLDAAMKSRRYRQAGKLKRCIRAHQLRLRRELQDRALQSLLRGDAHRSSQALSDTVGAGMQQTHLMVSSSDAALLSPYRSFYPPSTWLGVGRHPHSAWVDQRTGRYPQICTEETLQAVVHRFMNGDGADRDTLPDPYKALVSAPSSPPLSAALSRSQRAMKSSLFAAAYCTNVLTDMLDDLCFTLLQGLYKEQHDLRKKQPLQFKARQRYVVGFQEVLKCLKAGRVRLVLLATDVEAVEVSVSALPPPPSQPSVSVSGGYWVPSSSSRPAKKLARKKAFQTLHEAVQLVQQLCGVAGHVTRDTVAHLSGHSARAPPLCVSCMSRQRLSYALHAKGSKIGCVAVLQAEKNREALKAVMCYARYLTDAYTTELEATMAAEKQEV